MAVMMTKFTQNLRRGRSRQVGKGAVSCEVLECRRVLSAGVQLATAVPFDAERSIRGMGITLRI